MLILFIFCLASIPLLLLHSGNFIYHSQIYLRRIDLLHWHYSYLSLSIILIIYQSLICNHCIARSNHYYCYCYLSFYSYCIHWICIYHYLSLVSQSQHSDCSHYHYLIRPVLSSIYLFISSLSTLYRISLHCILYLWHYLSLNLHYYLIFLALSLLPFCSDPTITHQFSLPSARIYWHCAFFAVHWQSGSNLYLSLSSNRHSYLILHFYLI